MKKLNVNRRQESINKLREFLKDVDFEDISEKFENKSIVEGLINYRNHILLAVDKIFKNKEGLIAFLELFIDKILNFEKDLIDGGVVNKEIYDNIKDYVKETLNKNPQKVKEVYLIYKKSFKSKYPIDNYYDSILFFHAYTHQFFEFLDRVSIVNYREKFAEFFIRTLDNCEETEYKRYIFDWLLKFGYLVEAYIIDILRTQLKLFYTLNDIEYDEKKLIELSFYELEKELEEDNTFRLYRNQIFHTSFDIDFQVNPKERKIIFPELIEDKKELSIQEFLEYYFSVVQIIQSYRYAFTYAVPLEMREDGQKPMIELFRDFINELENIDFSQFDLNY